MSAQITLNWEKDLTFETLLDGLRLRALGLWDGGPRRCPRSPYP